MKRIRYKNVYVFQATENVVQNLADILHRLEVKASLPPISVYILIILV